uniref:Uncharacterized protein n=1 Tax=Loa loa TaxID=7209 RepID=A0A1I7VGQ1_LOALO
MQQLRMIRMTPPRSRHLTFTSFPRGICTSCPLSQQRLKRGRNGWEEGSFDIRSSWHGQTLVNALAAPFLLDYFSPVSSIRPVLSRPDLSRHISSRPVSFCLVSSRLVPSCPVPLMYRMFYHWLQ